MHEFMCGSNHILYHVIGLWSSYVMTSCFNTKKLWIKPATHGENIPEHSGYVIFQQMQNVAHLKG